MKKDCKHYRQLPINIFQNKCVDCGYVIGKMPKKKDRQKEMIREARGLIVQEVD